MLGNTRRVGRKPPHCSNPSSPKPYGLLTRSPPRAPPSAKFFLANSKTQPTPRLSPALPMANTSSFSTTPALKTKRKLSKPSRPCSIKTASGVSPAITSSDARSGSAPTRVLCTRVLEFLHLGYVANGLEGAHPSPASGGKGGLLPSSNAIALFLCFGFL